MHAVNNLRDAIRSEPLAEPLEPWDREGQGKPFRSEVKSETPTRLRLWVGHNPDEKACEVFASPYGVTLYADAERWLPILEAAVAKCRQMLAATHTGAADASD